MDSNSSRKNHTFLFVSFVLIVIFAFVSAIGSIVIGRKIDTYQRKVLITRAETATLSIDPSLVKALSGSKEDLTKDEYTQLKDKMRVIKNINSDARFVYLMGLKDTKLFFFVDSEPPTSTDYSAPGDIYDETTPEEVTNFKKGSSFVEGPYIDKWGHWVTAESSIVDPSTGQAIAVIGMDISTDIWRSEILFARIMIAISAALLTIFLLTLYLYLERSLAALDTLKKSHTVLQAQKTMMSESEEVAGLGRFTLLLGSGSMTWDSIMYSLMGIKDGEKITRELFESIIAEADRSKVRDLLDSLSAGREERGIIEFKIQNGERTRNVLSIMKAYKGPEGGVTRIVGTSQDVTHRN